MAGRLNRHLKALTEEENPFADHDVTRLGWLVKPFDVKWVFPFLSYEIRRSPNNAIWMRLDAPGPRNGAPEYLSVEITPPVIDPIAASNFIWRMSSLYADSHLETDSIKSNKKKYVHYEGNFERYLPWNTRTPARKILPTWFHGLVDDTFIDVHYNLLSSSVVQLQLTFGTPGSGGFFLEKTLTPASPNPARFQIATRISFIEAMSRALNDQDQVAFSGLLSFWCYQSFNGNPSDRDTVDNHPSALMLNEIEEVHYADVKDASTWDIVHLSVANRTQIEINQITYIMNCYTILNTSPVPNPHIRRLPEQPDSERQLGLTSLSAPFPTTTISQSANLDLTPWIRTFRINQCGYSPPVVGFDLAQKKEPLYVAAQRIGHTWRPEYPKHWKMFRAPNGVYWWWAAPPFWCGEFAYWVLSNSNWELANEMEIWIEGQKDPGDLVQEIDSPVIVGYFKHKNLWISASNEDLLVEFADLQYYIKTGYFYSHDNGYIHSGFFVRWDNAAPSPGLLWFVAINGNNDDISCLRRFSVREHGGGSLTWKKALGNENGGFGVVGKFIRTIFRGI